jgi:peroxiredoxin
MANVLTGEFDIVLEFAIPAANRVLAAMHRYERFSHSCSMRVNDTLPIGPAGLEPVVVGSVDASGDPTANHNAIGTRGQLLGQLTAANPQLLGLDVLANSNFAGVFEPPVTPSNLKGRAQLQVSPPTLQVPDASGARIRARMQVMARYFPDPQTSPLAEFVRGELQITADVSQVTSQQFPVSIVDINIKGENVDISFSPSFSSRPLTDSDFAAVNLLMRNALNTSFLPSNAPLPSLVHFLQIKTLAANPGALAVLLNLASPRGHSSSMNNLFVRPGDDFALGVGKEFVQAMLQLPLIRDHRDPNWDFSIRSYTLDFQDGQILLTIQGSTKHKSWPRVSADFTVKQAFTLQLVATTPGGHLDTVQLAMQGDPDLSIDFGWGLGWLIGLFTGSAVPTIRAQIQSSLDSVNPSVRQKLSAKTNLGDFLKSLLNPSHPKPGVPPPPDIPLVIAYTSVEITSSGIVLYGSISVPEWPPAHVEFEEIPKPHGSGPGGLATGDLFSDGPEYTALKTWIPGGTVEDYEWRHLGQGPPLLVEKNRFVYEQPPPAVLDSAVAAGPVPAFGPMVLIVRGWRWSPSGPVVKQPVTGTAGGYNAYPIFDGLFTGSAGTSPMIALTQPGPGGLVEVTGYAAARPTGDLAGAPNRLVHFAGEASSASLEILTQALRESGRADAATAVIAVLKSAQLSAVRHVPDIIYAEELGDAWMRSFGYGKTARPVTLIVNPAGKIVWQQEGELNRANLAAALRKSLVAAAPPRPRFMSPTLKLGRLAPNFVFDLEPGHGLTLRKLAGRPAILVFWKSSSKPSIDQVREMHDSAKKSGARAPAVIAINDGDPPDFASKVAAENRLPAILLPDPRGDISRAYGVRFWPTVVHLDDAGAVRKIQYGSSPAAPVGTPAQGIPSASKGERNSA